MMQQFRYVMTTAFTIGAAVISIWGFPAAASTDCTTVTALVSSCSSFVANGSPDPIPGSPCCVAMTTLNSVAASGDNRRTVCRCVMELVASNNPNATAIATLPGLCGVSLGFTIDPNTDCD
ncbi:Bifunctional inhibitor/lipid-transfer protein/seed storage 2S albumin superfamily protein [Perilla frutescens var. hirtella]|uniref:Bifunctional inhibitor/lipid-transfer protein/seed storage 2S albumin superfamily protein n=1 Tax=Perilla frutescens var. hirtella TaxID=608512 RepID=A0AAD4J6P9_PERFH|nr:Bifunctional inhibitor/lipid-transfer protein/seed storage 2S albumin superfamily protein [Perilla frutescens var. hirtella]KAH6815528.1 Bifunctional inhibitor/lipid-transfer protein/seed storage 2S albumin superfamily protein [Perilla frutescens var. frutescens]KAH6828227.1 Bifunctional inhibitor/lipid-transfer protein/seed storage 2S albumin superfamily protein [Perilla frutescens var. hirtella]